MVGAGGDSTADPDLIHLEFSWTQTESERWFSVIQGAVLRLLDPLMGRALLLREEILPQYTGGEGPDTAVDPAHARCSWRRSGSATRHVPRSWRPSESATKRRLRLVGRRQRSPAAKKMLPPKLLRLPC